VTGLGALDVSGTVLGSHVPRMAPARREPPGAVATRRSDLPMREQPIQQSRRDDAIEQAILGLLLLGERPIWSIAEIAQEIDDGPAAIDALNNLRAAGLVHRLDGAYVIASRAASRMAELWP
jgi:hypothetical protein